MVPVVFLLAHLCRTSISPTLYCQRCLCTRWSRPRVYTHRRGINLKAVTTTWRKDPLTICLRCLQTLPSKRKGVRACTNASSFPGSQEPDSDRAEPASFKEPLSIPTIRAGLTISGFALSFLSLAFDVVFTLFCYIPVGAGGLGLEVSCRVQIRQELAGPHVSSNSPRQSETSSHPQGHLLPSFGSSPCPTSCDVSTTPRRTPCACTFGPSYFASFLS